MSGLHREFTLNHSKDWQPLQAFILANARAAIDAGAPLHIIVTTQDMTRKAEQNKFYWSAVLKDISEQAWVDGKQFNKDVWHEYYARKFGVCDELIMPDGEVVLVRKSTTKMKVREFSEYLNEVQADAAQTLAVRFTTRSEL